MYNILRDKVRALTEAADAEAVGTKLAQDVSDFEEVKDAPVNEEETPVEVAADLAKDTANYADAETGDKEVLEGYLEEDDDEEGEWDKEDDEEDDSVSVATNPAKLDNPRTFEGVAKKILRAQGKLGTLKGLSVRVMTLEESRRNRLKKAGLYVSAYIGYAVVSRLLMGKAGQTLADKLIPGAGTDMVKSLDKENGGKGTVRGYYGKAVKAGLTYDAGYGGAIAGATLALKNKNQTIVLIADFKYGQKMYEVFGLKPEFKDANLDKKILKEVSKKVAELKTAKEWKVKEDVNPQVQLLSGLLLEEALLTEANQDLLNAISAASDSIAIKILKKQKKMGKIKSVSVKVLSISDSRKERLKKAGILVGATAFTSALVGAASGSISTTDAKKGAATGAAVYGSMYGTGAAIGAAAGTLAAKDLKMVVIVVEYAYGQKMFNVYSMNATEEKNGIHRKILKEISKSIAANKSARVWAIKEDTTEEEQAENAETDRVIEEVLAEA